jgi:hypothetical protein
VRCENCAHEDADVVLVHRVYVLVDRVSALDEDVAFEQAPVASLETPEQWCFSCRSQYPCTPCALGTTSARGGHATCLPPGAVLS